MYSTPMTWADGMSRYVNMITGEICDYNPEQVKGGILADAMGLGKTLTMISLLATDWPRQAKGVGPTLLVVPPSLLRTWEEELRRHTKVNTLGYWKHHGSKRSNVITEMLAYDIVLTSYNVVAMEWRNIKSGLKPLYSHSWHRIVLDEGQSESQLLNLEANACLVAHEIRSGATVRAKVIYALRGHLRWAITGTPIQNCWEDLVSLLKYLKAYPENDARSLKAMLRPNPASAHIRSTLSSICLRRPKNAIELPRRTDKIRRVEFDAEEAEYYNQMNDFVITNLQREAGQTHLRTYSNILAKINSLRQICNLGIHYEAAMDQSSRPQAQTAEMQEIFDGLLAAGAPICSKCNIDVVQDDSDYIGDPRLATCGEVICGSCFGLSETNIGATHVGCQRQSSCKLFAVDISGSGRTPMGAVASRLPVKIRALQSDILALPADEKR